jgi:hypothetical protein
MRTRFNKITYFALIGLISLMSINAFGQIRPYRVTDRQVQTLLNRVATRTDSFRQQVERINNNNSQIKEDLTTSVDDFGNATDNLRNNFTSRNSTKEDVQDVLNRASYINNLLQNNRVNITVQNQWNLIRTDLNSLANYYRVSWNWNTTPNNPTYPTNNNSNYPTNNPRNFDARLTGTYRLNTSLSDNVNTAIDRAVSTINNNSNQRDRVQRNLERRLTAPDVLAIDKRGQQVTIASSISPQISFNADNISRSETNANGRTVQTRVSATSSDLTINYEGDRVNDFYVSFTPVNNNQLRVTRRVYLENRNETVSVTSVYDKTDQTARWDNITYQNNYPTDNNTSNTTYDDFVVTNNTRLLATLDAPLSTKNFKDGDRFSMTVTSPSEYQGAIVEGTVNGQKSGVVSGRANLSLNFNTIRLRNGKTYRFAGIVDQVRQPNGDNVSVNNEGVVRDSNQTTKTVTRAGIGAALGAIIGAIAGGGSGAAIGAGIGAGAGAGSVVLQGRDNLELQTGTEFSITASAPTNR